MWKKDFAVHHGWDISRNELSELHEYNLATSKKINPILTKLLPYTEYLRNICRNFYKNILRVTMILHQLNNNATEEDAAKVVENYGTNNSTDLLKVNSSMQTEQLHF